MRRLSLEEVRTVIEEAERWFARHPGMHTCTARCGDVMMEIARRSRDPRKKRPVIIAQWEIEPRRPWDPPDWEDRGRR